MKNLVPDGTTFGTIAEKCLKVRQSQRKFATQFAAAITGIKPEEVDLLGLPIDADALEQAEKYSRNFLTNRYESIDEEIIRIATLFISDDDLFEPIPQELFGRGQMEHETIRQYEGRVLFTNQAWNA